MHKLHTGHCVWVTIVVKKNHGKQDSLHQGSELAPSWCCAVLLRLVSCLVAFLVLKWQALGACDEYYILLEENNFTDLTFGEKENSEQGPTVCTKQARWASSFECASVIFQSPWRSLGLQLISFAQNPFLWERVVVPYAHICPLCVMLCSFEFPAHSAL